MVNVLATHKPLPKYMYYIMIYNKKLYNKPLLIMFCNFQTQTTVMWYDGLLDCVTSKQNPLCNNSDHHRDDDPVAVSLKQN